MMLSAANTVPDIAGDTSLLGNDTFELTTIMSSSKSMTVIDPNTEMRKRRMAKLLAARRKKFGLQQKDSNVNYKPGTLLQADSAWLSRQYAAPDTVHHR